MSHETHVVALTVFVRAEGVDARDAANVAEEALRQTFAGSDAAVTIRTYAGHERHATILEVTEVGAALRAGVLAVRPAEVWRGQPE